MKNKNRFQKSMSFQVILITFITLLFVFGFVLISVFIFIKLQDWEIEIQMPRPNVISPFKTLFFISIISFIIGILVSIYLSRRWLRPISNLKKLTGEVAKGNFEKTIAKEDIPNNEIGEFMENFNTMVLELRKNEVLKSDFISNVSHEFKTPLSIIQGYVTLLQDEKLTEEERIKYSQTIFEASQKLTVLVNDILKISKIDSKKISVENSSYQLDEQIRECILSFENLWSKKNLELNINLEGIEIHADKSLMINVWNNLINNAIKFSDTNGRIDINLYSENDDIIFKIKDYGCGIKQEDIPYIFDKFYQSDKSHKIEGNGLGLALVKKIITLYGGQIDVNSSLNEYSEFIVTLNKNLTQS